MKETCPCCGKTKVGCFEICEECGWSNDYAQAAHPDMKDGDNEMSLNEARKAYKEGKEIF